MSILEDKEITYLSSIVLQNPRGFSNIIKSKKNKKLLEKINEFPIGNSLNEKIYLIINNQNMIPLCKNCNKNNVKLKDNVISKGWNLYCSKNCVSIITNSKRKQYYKDNPIKLQNFKEKYSKTWHSNEKNLEVVKKQQLNRENNNIIKYGVKCVFELPEIQEKCHKNNISTGNKYKNFISPISNKEYKIRGYEYKAITFLEQQNRDFIADDFKTPTIEYYLHSKLKRYYPDIFIKNENLIIEVKSEYWLYKQYEKNLNIQKSCLSKNYKFEFWIFDGSSNDQPQIINII
jgi:hypothetical protein